MKWMALPMKHNNFACKCYQFQFCLFSLCFFFFCVFVFYLSLLANPNIQMTDKIALFNAQVIFCLSGYPNIYILKFCGIAISLLWIKLCTDINLQWAVCFKLNIMHSVKSAQRSSGYRGNEQWRRFEYRPHI